MGVAARLLTIALLLGGCAAPPPGPPPPDPDKPPISTPGTPEWYAANEALVREYLTTLPDAARGKPVKGITLSDGARWLEGYVFLGRPPTLPPHVHVALFRDGERRLAYIWLDPEAEPLPLERCEEQGRASIRARRLGGGVHAWRAIRPEHGIVYTDCPPPAWLPDPATPPTGP